MSWPASDEVPITGPFVVTEILPGESPDDAARRADEAAGEPVPPAVLFNRNTGAEALQETYELAASEGLGVIGHREVMGEDGEQIGWELLLDPTA